MRNAKVSSRELRRQLARDEQMLHEQAVPRINTLLHNDGVTQRAVTELRKDTDQLRQDVDQIAINVGVFRNRGFWQRLNWVFRGA